MTTKCPTCGRKLRKERAKAVVDTVRITRAEQPTAFNAWLRYFFATRQAFRARYWARRGYMLVPTEFPPVQKPPDAGARDAAQPSPQDRDSL